MSVEAADRSMIVSDATDRIEPAPTRPTPVLERLHALVRKGYRASIGTETDTNVIILRHLGRAPDLILHADGMIEPLEGRRPWHKRNIESLGAIAPEGDSEQLRFMKFLDTVPRATFRDRTRPWRNKYIYFPIVLIIVWGLCLALTTAFFEL